MAIRKIPAYRYPLFDRWDKEAFDLISTWAKEKKYPEVIGNKEEVNRLLVILIRTQKALHNWRGILEDIVGQVREGGTIDAKELLAKYPPESISRDIPAWVTYEEDKKVSDFIDELGTRKVIFEGTNKERGEFILRFILGQLGNDWELTILMIRELLGDGGQLNLKDLNKELVNFDYLNLFY